MLFKLIARLPFHHLSYSYYRSTPKVILLDDLKLAYIPIPKVAHTAIKMAIAKLPLSAEARAHQLDYIQVPQAQLDRQQYYCFAFVRNPLIRLISLYERNINEEYPAHLFFRYGTVFRHKMEFSDFVKAVCNIPDRRADKHFRSQHCFLVHNGEMLCDFIGKVENFQDDWDYINQRYPIGPVKQVNFSMKKDLSSYFTPDLFEMAVKRYQRDIELLGYEEDVKEMMP
ncbi:MAG: sulfotransferase family protein [Roseivirga sp.]|nr:sulfotransferase family protein [Roseivirga sp.]